MEKKSKIKIIRSFPYHRRLFMLLLAFSWVLVACFVTFQYGREKLFKAEKLNNVLQMFNMRLIDNIEQKDSLAGIPEITRKALSAFSPSLGITDIRVSVIRLDGTVVYDNSLDTVLTENHLDRPEIAEAMKSGTGYTIRRQSETTGISYFYSAMRGNSLLVRSAVPYSLSLRELLAADRSFLWFMLGVTLIISLVGYIATRRIGQTITRLNRFAEKAERGEKVNTDEVFPHDELGDISNHIVTLYARLQAANENVRREHQRTLFEEQEKIRIKKQLTNNINHELKTPVTSICVCIETILNHPELSDEKRDQFLQRCYSNSERLCSLLNDVSTITRMDEGSQQIEKEKVNLNTILNDVVGENDIRLSENGIEMHVDFNGDVTLNGNQSLLESVFRNLIDNAIAYASCKNIYIRLVENDAEKCRITFADDGVGVEAKHLPHLFERFYRVDKGRSRKLGGTGLGLSIVNNAVALHGGVITVDNRPGGGLLFDFTLKKNT